MENNERDAGKQIERMLSDTMVWLSAQRKTNPKADMAWLLFSNLAQRTAVCFPCYLCEAFDYEINTTVIDSESWQECVCVNCGTGAGPAKWITGSYANWNKRHSGTWT